jgi:hypothetical protein
MLEKKDLLQFTTFVKLFEQLIKLAAVTVTFK